MSTVIGRHRLLVLVFLVLLMSACKTVSTAPSIPPTPPEVRCKQPDTPAIKPAPQGKEWVDAHGLSERAAVWIAELLGTVAKERSYRKIEHDCLDNHEKQGAIRQ